MALSREIRESLLTVLSPVPYLLILLPVLSVFDSVASLWFLFVFSLTMTFFYLLVARGVALIRSNLSQRKDALPTADEHYYRGTYTDRFLSISRDAFVGFDSDIEPISEYTARPPFPYLVYAFWGSLVSLATFVVSGRLLAWLVSSGQLNSVSDIPVPEEALQSVPLGLVDLLLALFPAFGKLDFAGQVLIGGVTFSTGFMFLTAARNLTALSDDFHRRVLRWMVATNPYGKHELLHLSVFVAFYGFFFLLM
ncbi:MULTISPECIES: hypothetical protein [Haloferax]|uniref:hypothetical protein n=1 Tax=Haloferax TaxID=2251 RepID=UPI000737C4A2|nr:hypothetical protein [Haloferax sp. Q22]